MDNVGIFLNVYKGKEEEVKDGIQHFVLDYKPIYDIRKDLNIENTLNNISQV